MMRQAMKSIVVAGCTLGLVAGMGAPASAKPKQLSDKSVRVLMTYAWSLVPSKFTTPNGKVIITDRSKPKLALVPLDVAREVIRVGRLSAFAQNCDLREAQIANYRTLMRVEREKKKWSDQQILFINQLHLLTVMWLTGHAKVVSKGDNKAEKKVERSVKHKKPVCDKTRKGQIVEAIARYVKSHPPSKKAAATKLQVQPAAGKVTITNTGTGLGTNAGKTAAGKAAIKKAGKKPAKKVKTKSASSAASKKQ